jgi:hypothetical protein
MQGLTKLHGVTWGQWDRVSVDIVEAVVADGPGPTVVLRDNAQGTEAKVLELFDHACWEKDPLSFLDHVEHFLVEEVLVLKGRFVRSPSEGRL